MLDMNIELNELDELNYTFQEELNKARNELCKTIEEREEMEEDVRIRNTEIYENNSKIKSLENIKFTFEEVMTTTQTELDTLISITNKDKLNLNNLSSKLISTSQSYCSLVPKLKISKEFKDAINIIKKNFDTCIDIVSKLENVNQQYFEKLKKAYSILANRENIVNNKEEETAKVIWRRSSRNIQADVNNNSNLFNLNINKNININIINPNQNNSSCKKLPEVEHKRHARNNSFSHFNNSSLENVEKQVKTSHSPAKEFLQPPKPKRIKSFIGGQRINNRLGRQSMDFSSGHNSHHFNSNKSISVNEYYTTGPTRNEEFDINCFNLNENEIDEYKEEIMRHNETILELTENIYKLEKEVSDFKTVVRHQDEKIDLDEIVLKHNEDKIFQMSVAMEDEKSLFLKDLTHKENQILALHEKYSNSQELNFKLTNFSKDKKKFIAMEQQIKDLSNIIQNVSFYLYSIIF